MSDEALGYKSGLETVFFCHSTYFVHKLQSFLFNAFLKISRFSELAKIENSLLRLWENIHYSVLNLYALNETQNNYEIKSLSLVKAVVRDAFHT